GIVGHKRLPARVGRNESFNHAGNVSFALLAGAVGTWAGQKWIFYACATVALGTVCSAMAIRSRDVDNSLARGAASDEAEGGRAHVASLRDLLKRRYIWIFAVSVILF